MSSTHSRSSLYSSRKSSSSKANIAGLSTSKRNVAFESKLDKPAAPKSKPVAQVFDEDGEDVTPRSLTAVPDAPGLTRKESKVQTKAAINFQDNSSIATPSEIFNQSGMYGAASAYQRSSYAAGFSTSLMGSRVGSMMGSRASLDSITDEIAEPNQGRQHHEPSGLQGISRQVVDTKEVLVDDDLIKQITITLEETETIWHLDIPGTSVQSGTDEAEQVEEKNSAYEKLLSHRVGNDMFAERGMQTFNDAPKNKEVQTDVVGMKDADCMATTWDMYDTYNEKEKKKVVDNDEDMDILESTATKLNTAEESLSSDSVPIDSLQLAASKMQPAESKASFMSASVATVTSETDQSTNTTTQGDNGELDLVQETKRIFKMDSLKENVFIMERTIVQNIFHQRQAAYRGLPTLTVPALEASEADKPEKEEQEDAVKIGPNLSRLWAYACPETKGKLVNCMGWNKVNKDLLAVGYGCYGHSVTGKGLACVWSIKNPEHPERIYETRCAVTSLDFSLAHPNLLAVGLYDGTIQVFNTRNIVNIPILDSLDSPGKHTSAIWQLMWIERDKGTGDDKGEVLISGSGDGRITQWTIRKGFEFLDMLKLKRVNVAKQAASGKKPGAAGEAASTKKSDALISRYTCGMSFDFHRTDGNIYMVGTEEGHIHKCSCSYNEQFLDTYSAHTGPVYRVVWSPFDDSAFLSCSADWSMCLWHQDKLQPLLTLQGSTKAIHGIDWSPSSPTMFAAVNDDQIEVWDLAVSILDPLLVNLPISKVSLSSVLFAQNSEALLVGDSEGHVTIYHMREMPPVKEFQSDWLTSLATSKPSPTEDDNK